MMQASSAARRPGTERVPSRQNGGAVRRRRGTWDRVAAQFPWQVRGGSQPTYHEPEPLEGSWLGTLAKAVAVAAVFAAYVVVCVVLTVPDRLAIGLFALALVGAVAWFGWRLADADSVIDSLNAALIAVFVFYAAGGFILTIPFGWRAHLLPWGALVTAVVVSLVQRLCRRHRVTEWTPLRRNRPAGAAEGTATRVSARSVLPATTTDRDPQANAGRPHRGPCYRRSSPQDLIEPLDDRRHYLG